MKKTIILVFVFFCTSLKMSLAVPSAPVLSVSTTGINISVSWTGVPGADGYRLSYAPFPFTGAETIESIDMGPQTSLSGDLWSGAAYYVAVQAYDQSGNSGYSNVEVLFTRAVSYDNAFSAVASGTYTRSGSSFTGYFTASNWPDGGGPPVGVSLPFPVVTLTETTLEFRDEENKVQTWHRPASQTGNIVGTWTRFEEDQDRFVLQFGTNGTVTVTGHGAIFSVPYGTMSIDGDYSDWTTGYRVYADVDGPDCGNAPGLDLTEVYLAQDESFIYVRFVLNGPLDPNYGYKFGNGGRHIYVAADGLNGYFFYASGSNPPSPHLSQDFLHIDGNQFECKFYKHDVLSYWNGAHDFGAWLDQGSETVCRDKVDLPVLQFWF
jgi:hypothetical protein